MPINWVQRSAIEGRARHYWVRRGNHLNPGSEKFGSSYISYFCWRIYPSIHHYFCCNALVLCTWVSGSLNMARNGRSGRRRGRPFGSAGQKQQAAQQDREQRIASALEDIRNGSTLKQASENWCIPSKTLGHRKNGRKSHQEAHESQQALSPVEEDSRRFWILTLGCLICPVACAISKMMDGHQERVGWPPPICFIQLASGPKFWGDSDSEEGNLKFQPYLPLCPIPWSVQEEDQKMFSDWVGSTWV